MNLLIIDVFPNAVNLRVIICWAERNLKYYSLVYGWQSGYSVIRIWAQRLKPFSAFAFAGRVTWFQLGTWTGLFCLPNVTKTVFSSLNKQRENILGGKVFQWGNKKISRKISFVELQIMKNNKSLKKLVVCWWSSSYEHSENAIL